MEDAFEAAKQWLEENTGFRWATDPDPVCPDVSLSTLNRRMRMRAKMMAEFAEQYAAKLLESERERIEQLETALRYHLAVIRTMESAHVFDGSDFALLLEKTTEAIEQALVTQDEVQAAEARRQEEKNVE